MRVSIVVLTFLICLSTLSLFAQKAHISDSDNKWIIYAVWAHGQERHFGGFSIGDTASKNGNIYRQLIAGKSTVQALLRDDTVAGKVYAINISSQYTGAGDTNEYVLYDYNLVKGDTFKIVKADTSKTVVWVVEKIDTFHINGVPHKRFHLDGIGPYTWDMKVIEGVGSLINPMFPYIGDYFEYGCWVICFKSKGTYYPISDPPEYGFTHEKNCNDSFLSVTPIKHDAVVLKVYPVPAKENVTIDLENAINTGTACLYNSLGELVLEIPIKNRERITIENRNYPPGIYRLKIADNKTHQISFAKIVFL